MSPSTSSPPAAPPAAGSRGVRRRAVATGLGWAAPIAVIATAAPALAVSSSCSAQTVDCAALSRTWNVTQIPVNGYATAMYGKTTVKYTASGTTGTAGNSSVPQDRLTGGASSALRWTLPGTTGSTETATFTFSPAVASVSFTLLGIDRTGTQYDDQVALSPVPSARTLGSALAGSGTSTDPFRAASTATNGVPQENTEGNVALRWDGSISMITITYSQGPNAKSAAAAPFIGISNVVFTPSVC